VLMIRGTILFLFLLIIHSQGGAILFKGSKNTLIDCTFTDNKSAANVSFVIAVFIRLPHELMNVNNL
jgi:hypothetical protein